MPIRNDLSSYSANCQRKTQLIHDTLITNLFIADFLIIILKFKYIHGIIGPFYIHLNYHFISLRLIPQSS
jgi:hypothetical protein